MLKKTRSILHVHPLSPAGTFDYVIITRNSIITSCQSIMSDFEEYKEDKGYTVLTVTEDGYYEDLDDSKTNGGWGGGTGPTASTNIRNWLTEDDGGNPRWSLTGIKYVLLIGDPEDTYGDVPMRRVKAIRNSEYIPATDYYYADLTGNWNIDNDSYFGEGSWKEGQIYHLEDFANGGVDQYVDIYVGRIPVYQSQSNWTTKLTNIMNKTIDYGSVSSESVSWRFKVILPIKYFSGDPGWQFYEMGDSIKQEFASPRHWISRRIYDGGMYDLTDLPLERTICQEEYVQEEWTQENGTGVTGAGLNTWFTRGQPPFADQVFYNDQVQYLNDNLPSIVCSCSCGTGYPWYWQGTTYSDNLAYNLLCNGAIFVVACATEAFQSHENYWNQNATLTNVGYRFSGKIISGKETSESFYYSMGLVDLNPISGNGNDYTWHNMPNYTLYGDPSIYIFETGYPDIFSLKKQNINLLSVNKLGNLRTLRECITSLGPNIEQTPGVDYWTVKDGETILAALDMNGDDAGRLQLKGGLLEVNTPSESHVLVIKNGDEVLASIDSNGTMYLKGRQYSKGGN